MNAAVDLMPFDRPVGESSLDEIDFEFGALKDANNYRAAIVSEFSSYLQGRVMEVGSGVGQMTALLRKLQGITTLLAVEPNFDSCLRLQALFRDQETVHGTVRDISADEPWNALVSVNVLQEIQEDVLELEAYRARLRNAAGCLCLFVPARPEIYAPIDAKFGHRRRYMKEELVEKLEKAKFQVLKIRYFNSLGYFGWWLNFWLLRRKHLNAEQIGSLDRDVFPKVHAFESKYWNPPFGQSLIAVARAKW